MQVHNFGGGELYVLCSEDQGTRISKDLKRTIAMTEFIGDISIAPDTSPKAMAEQRRKSLLGKKGRW